MGPGPGELALFDLNDSIEIVDDVNFRPLRNMAEQSLPTDFALSHDGHFAAWHAGRSHVYVVQEIANGKTVKSTLENTRASPRLVATASCWLSGKPSGRQTPKGEGKSEMKLFDLSGKLVRTLRSRAGSDDSCVQVPTARRSPLATAITKRVCSKSRPASCYTHCHGA